MKAADLFLALKCGAVMLVLALLAYYLQEASGGLGLHFTARFRDILLIPDIII